MGGCTRDRTCIPLHVDVSCLYKQFSNYHNDVVLQLGYHNKTLQYFLRIPNFLHESGSQFAGLHKLIQDSRLIQVCQKWLFLGNSESIILSYFMRKNQNATQRMHKHEGLGPRHYFLGFLLFVSTNSLGALHTPAQYWYNMSWIWSSKNRTSSHNAVCSCWWGQIDSWRS